MWNFMQFTWQRGVPTGNARLKLLDPFAGYFCARRTKSTQNTVYKSSSYSTPPFVPDKKLQSQPSKYGHAQKVIKVFFTAPSTFTFHFHSSLLPSLSVPCLYFLCWKYTRFHFLAKRSSGDTGEPKTILKKNTLVVAGRTKLRFFRFVLFCYFFSFVFLSGLFDWIKLIFGCLVLKDRFPL